MTSGNDKRAARARLWREKQQETRNFINAVVQVQQRNAVAIGARMAKGVQTTKVSKEDCGVKKRKGIVCYACGKPGHIVKQCRYVKRVLRGVDGDVKCFQCKQLGHMRRQCPQLKIQDHGGVEDSHQIEGVVGQLSELQDGETLVVSSDHIEG